MIKHLKNTRYHKKMKIPHLNFFFSPSSSNLKLRHILVSKLDLSGNNIESAGAKALGEGLQVCLYITYLLALLTMTQILVNI